MNAHDTHPVWRLANGRSLVLDRPRIMAIINVTPDSFSDGGQHLDPAAALDRAEQAAGEGADMLDIGAESTRPGAAPVPDAEQTRRLIPVIERVRASSGPAARLPISVDTTRESVARAALDAGADAVNDQSAGLDDGAGEDAVTKGGGTLGLVAQRGAGVILMHRLRAPAADHYSHQYPSEPDYGPIGVVGTVRGFLSRRTAAARQAGVHADAIVLDPGLGFGKSVAQNWELFRAIAGMRDLGHPVLCALSRKSFIGAAMARDSAAIPAPHERVTGSVGAALALALQGVRLFRVHDVKEHRAAFDAAGRLIESLA